MWIVYNVMIFDWSGLKEHRYFIINQKSDPLKYCNYPLPVPMAVGLPFMPCDLPNEYELISTDDRYEEQGDVYLTLTQEVGFMQRFLLPASHRPWTITGYDYYQHTPYEGIRETNCCLSGEDRPSVQVKYQQKYIGRVSQTTILNCCCFSEIYQAFQIENHIGQVIYRVISHNPQRGHFLVLPCWGFDRIKYEIIRVAKEPSTLVNVQQHQIGQGQNLMGQAIVGQIMHLFNGLSEYSSKNDKYGITFPQGASQQQKCLIVYCTLLIDYLLFCNF